MVRYGSYRSKSNVSKDMKKIDKKRNPTYLLAYLLILIVKNGKLILSRVGW